MPTPLRPSRPRLARGPMIAARAAAAALVLVLVLAAAPAFADDVVAPDLQTAAAAGDADKLIVSGTLYIWAAGLSGKASTLPPLPATRLDFNFGDVLRNLDGALMGAVEVRKDRWIVLGDLMLTQVSPEATLPGRRGSVDLRARSLTLEGELLYRFYQSEAIDVDAGAGLRFWQLYNKLSVNYGRPQIHASIDQTESWVDPILAARVLARLGGPWSVNLYGDVGGFDVGSQFTWQALGTLNYQWNEHLSLRAGYRALSVDYQNGGFLYDVLMQGPVLGATYRF